MRVPSIPQILGVLEDEGKTIQSLDVRQDGQFLCFGCTGDHIKLVSLAWSPAVILTVSWCCGVQHFRARRSASHYGYHIPRMLNYVARDRGLSASHQFIEEAAYGPLPDLFTVLVICRRRSDCIPSTFRSHTHTPDVVVRVHWQPCLGLADTVRCMSRLTDSLYTTESLPDMLPHILRVLYEQIWIWDEWKSKSRGPFHGPYTNVALTTSYTDGTEVLSCKNVVSKTFNPRS